MRQLNSRFRLATLMGMALMMSAAEGQTGQSKGKPAPELNIVDMLDANGQPTGRLVEFSGKRKMLKESGVDAKGIYVRLDFVNGQSRQFYLPEALLEKFAAHGAEQKLGDEMAGVDDIDDCVMAIDDLIDRLYEGNWAAKREANAMAGASILAKAMVQQSGKDLAVVRAFLGTLSHAQKVALRANKTIAPIVAELEALKSSKKKPGPVVDTDSLLDALTSGAALTSTQTADAAA